MPQAAEAQADKSLFPETLEALFAAAAEEEGDGSKDDDKKDGGEKDDAADGSADTPKDGATATAADLSAMGQPELQQMLEKATASTTLRYKVLYLLASHIIIMFMLRSSDSVVQHTSACRWAEWRTATRPPRARATKPSSARCTTR